MDSEFLFYRWFSINIRNPVSFSGILFSDFIKKSTDDSFSLMGLDSRTFIGEPLLSTILVLEYSLRFAALLLVGLFGFFYYFLDRA
jgi:hypothetical protein